MALVPTATGTRNVSITIQSRCTVISASAINFGSMASIAANIDLNSTLTVRCSSATPYTMGLSAGGGTGASVATRKMSSGANSVNYSLFRNATRTQVWGQTIGTDTVTGTGTGANQVLIIDGRVPAQAMLRKIGERTVSGLWIRIGSLVDNFQPAECANYFTACGCDPD